MAHFVFVANHLAFNERQTAQAEHFNVGIGIESDEPWACAALVVGFFAFLRVAKIPWLVAVAVRAECAQAFGREQFACNEVEHALALATVEWRIVESGSDNHVWTYAWVGIISVDIVVEVARVVEECCDERSLNFVGEFFPSLHVVNRSHVVGKQVLSEAQSIIPQGIELNHESRARNDWSAVGARSIHPSHRLLGAVGGYETVFGNFEVRMLLVDDEAQYVLHQFAVALGSFLRASVLGILLHVPNCPQRYVGQVEAVEVLVDFAGFDECGECFLGSVHNAFEIRTVVHRDGGAWQRDEFVAGASLEPWITSQDVTAAVGLGYIELLSAVLHTVVEAGSRRAGLDFVLIHFVELTSVHLFGAGREDYAFAFFDF